MEFWAGWTPRGVLVGGKFRQAGDVWILQKKKERKTKRGIEGVVDKFIAVITGRNATRTRIVCILVLGYAYTIPI